MYIELDKQHPKWSTLLTLAKHSLEACGRLAQAASVKTKERFKKQKGCHKQVMPNMFLILIKTFTNSKFQSNPFSRLLLCGACGLQVCNGCQFLFEGALCLMFALKVY